MNLFVLDTDHLTLLRYGQPAVVTRVDGVPVAELAVTIITIEEQLTGWYSQVRQARDDEKLARAYEGLFQVIDSAKRLKVLPFRLPAVQRYRDLRKQFPRLGKLDLSIAAIVLEHDATLITRNRSDFEQIPNLRIEDWSRPLR